jgi:processive 1,2-diacylglycerol beta-glucosyltransferase
MYARLARYHPRLWELLFHATNRADLGPGGAALLRPLIQPRLAALLEQEQPDLIVSVLPVVNSLLVDAAGRLPRPARLEVVLTDWAEIHRTWVAPGVDFYTAPTDQARQDCHGYGVPPVAIQVVGIPVRAQFTTGSGGESARISVLRELGLEPSRFTILAMVGAEGSPRALRNIAALTDLPLAAQLIVVCGRNRCLLDQVEALPGRLPRRTLGFVHNVADLMRSCDLLVTKAGGVTLAEAFTSGVPVVLHDLLPGQEAGNMRYVLRHEAAVFAPNGAALRQAVTTLFEQPERRAALAASGRDLARPEAAATIASALLRRAAAH